MTEPTISDTRFTVGDGLEKRALFTEPTLTDPWYLNPGERVLWSRDSGDGTGVLRVKQPSGVESVFDVYYDVTTATERTPSMTDQTTQTNLIAEAERLAEQDVRNLRQEVEEEDVKPCPSCNQPQPAGLVTSPTGEPVPCEECLRGLRSRAFSVTRAVPYDGGTAHEHIVRIGYEAFTLERLSQLLNSLEQGQSATLTVVRHHDNAR